MNVPVDIFFIVRVTSHSIESTASSTLCPEWSQEQAIILEWA